MNVIGQLVKHNSLGVGQIISCDESQVNVEFENGLESFIYPDAFDKYLSFVDETLQNEISAELSKKNDLKKNMMEIVTEKRSVSGFTTLNEWNIILDGVFEGTEYRAMLNGGSGSAAGVAIVPKDADTPQFMCVYPKKKTDAAIVLKPFLYEKLKNRITLTPVVNNGKKVSFREVPDDEIIKMCKLLLS